MKVAFLFSEAFPDGLAGTNRVRSLAKGLIERGHSVKVYCLRPTEKPGRVLNRRISGRMEGVDFEYTGGTVVWPDNRFAKGVAWVRAAILGMRSLSRDHRQSPYACVISTLNFWPVSAVFGVWVKRRLGVPWLLAVDEYPIALRRSRWKYSLPVRMYVRNFYRPFDALLVMTRVLMEYYRDKIGRDAVLFHLPMTVDLGRFRVPGKARKFGFPYVAYCGNMSHANNRDGLPDLIRAFHGLAGGFPSLKLVMIGGSGGAGPDPGLKGLADELGLSDRVVFTGRIEREEMAGYLGNAAALVLVKRENRTNQGNFPSKLGEYLATGRPVVATRTGEISLYLKDRGNAVLVPPGDVEAIAAGMRYLLENPRAAANIGKAGKRVADRVFNYRVQGRRLSGFIAGLESSARRGERGA
jgi:glycosyltransferase involved in cell wall biosynthesis